MRADVNSGCEQEKCQDVTIHTVEKESWTSRIW